MDCFEKAMLFLVEEALARYGFTGEVKIIRKEEEAKG